MRRKALVFTAALGLLGLPGLANAVPGAPSPAATGVATSPGLLQVRDGCGPGWHAVPRRDRWGHWYPRCCRSTALILVPGPARMGVPVRGMVLTGAPAGVITTASRRQPTGYAGRQ